MKRLLATAVAAVLSVPLLGAPPAAATSDVSPNLVSHGTFSPEFGLADNGWDCGPGTVHEFRRPGAEFVQMLPLKDPFVPRTVVARPASAQPTASVPATPEATSPTPVAVPAMRRVAGLVQQAPAIASSTTAGPPAASSTPASAPADAGTGVRSDPESALTKFPFNRMPASDARDWVAIRAWADEVADLLGVPSR